MSDIITGTPAELTYLHPFVRDAWTVVWAIASGALIVILGWMGLTFIVGEHLGSRTAGWREMVPRLVLGLVAAASSLWWCALVIDVADAVSGFIAASLFVAPGDLLQASLAVMLSPVLTGSVGLIVLMAILYLIYAFFVLFVIVQMVLRLALIDILLALAPMALGLWILPHTSGWGRHWLRLFMTTVFQQAIQLIALAMALAFLNEVAGITAFDAVQDIIMEAPALHRLRLHGDQGAGHVGQHGHLRLLDVHPLLRHGAAQDHARLRPVHRADRRRSRRPGRDRGGGGRRRFRRWRIGDEVCGGDGHPIGRWDGR